MFFPSATVAAALVFSLAGAAPSPATIAGRAVSPPASSAVKVAAGLWAPKKSKPKPAKDERDAQEDELLKARKPAAGDATAPKPKRRPIKMDDSAEEGDDDAEEGDDDDEEEKPKVVKRRKRVVEEEDEAPEPIVSQPSVIPRAVNFALGPAILRRSFAYNVANEQGDHGFRLGYQFALESFPLVSRPSGWYRTLGIGAYYEKEYGDATVTDQMSGLFRGAAVNHGRWGF